MKTLKYYRLRKIFSTEQKFQKFGATLEEVVHYIFRLEKRIITFFYFSTPFLSAKEVHEKVQPLLLFSQIMIALQIA